MMTDPTTAAVEFNQPAPVRSNQPKVRHGSKRAICVEMLLRPEGATREQLLAATGWPTISVQDVVSRTGMELISTRMGRRITYQLNFEPAKKPSDTSHFLQNVAKPKRATRPTSKVELKKLTRVAFKVSRLMEFCSERELQNQTGHSVYDWPLVVGKELMDNALDAAEEAEVAPEITIIVDSGTITIQDNAGGIDTDTIGSILDYSIRVSSREAYVSPTRGAQGNALKTIFAMGFVLNRKIDSDADAAGITIIESRGITHQIAFCVDHINNQPKIIHTTAESPVTVGTKFTIHWPDNDLLEDAGEEFRRLIEAYAWFNPHLTLRGLWFGHEFINVEATNPNWEKWRPRNPTSPHWYDESRLQRYLAAHVARNRDLGQHRTVREFIAEFRGLSGTAIQRKILAEVGCSHKSLAQFFGIEQVNRAGIATLLAAMRKYSKPVAPKHLGFIGIEPFQADVSGVRRQYRDLQVSIPQRNDQRGHSLHSRVRLRATSVWAVASRCRRFPQIRHRRQLECRD